jgi:hypothetical protein
MTVDQYLQTIGKIVPREIGEKRFDIDKNYQVVDGQFVAKRQAPAIVVAKDPAEEPEDFLNWISKNSGFIQGLTKTVGEHGMDHTKLSDIQAFLIDSDYPFIFTDKCRQFGFSFISAARGLAKAMLLDRRTTIFVSYNEEESKQKITYAKELYESLPNRYKLGRKLKYDNKTSLVFEKTGQATAETRILSYPQRILRGKGGGVDVVLDEFAHCIHARDIYRSALPVISRGGGTMCRNRGSVGGNIGMV